VYWNYAWWDGSAWNYIFPQNQPAYQFAGTTSPQEGLEGVPPGTPLKVTWGWTSATARDILSHVTTTGATSYGVADTTVTFENVLVKIDTFYSNNTATEDPVHPTSPSDTGAVWIVRTTASSTSYDLPVAFSTTGSSGTFSPSGDWSLKENFTPYPYVTSSTTIHSSFTYIELLVYAWWDNIYPENGGVPETAVVNIVDTSPDKTYGILSPDSYTVNLYDVQ
jgi:hypothetical protein